MATKTYTVKADIGDTVYFSYKNKATKSTIKSIQINDDNNKQIFKYEVVLRYNESSAGILTTFLSENDIYLNESDVIIN